MSTKTIIAGIKKFDRYNVSLEEIKGKVQKKNKGHQLALRHL